MPEQTHKPAPERAHTQPVAPAPNEAEELRLLDDGPQMVASAAPAGADDAAARHAAVLGDARLMQRMGVGQRASLVWQLQRGYGNGHVARVMARVQPLSDLPIHRRESGTESATEDRPPTEAEKVAALKAAAVAEQAATQTNSKGADQAGQAKSAKASEQAVGQTAKQQALAANSAAKSAIQGGKDAKRSGGGAGKAKRSGGATDLAAGATGSPAPGKAPATPGEDQSFQAVIGKVKGAGSKQKAHPSAQSKAAGAQAAAESPASELSSKAQANQVVKMQQAEAPPFDAAGFKAKLMEKIAATAPKNAQEADSFKESDKLGGVKGEMQGSVKEEQTKSQGPIEQQTAAEPDASGVAPKPVTPLAPTEPGAPPAPVGAEAAAPKPKTASEIEAPLQENTKQVDQQMASAEVSEEQLKESNEPEFQGALEAKGQAQAQAQTGPQEYRQAEQAQINAAQGAAANTAEGHTQAMHGSRASLLQQVSGQQNKTKSKDEQERAKIGADIQNIYKETKTNVENQLKGLDAKVNQAFDQGATAAKKTFEDFVESKMNAFKEKRYGGWFGWARWAKDKIAGMPAEVNAFYSEGRNLYMREMDAVIDRVVTIVGATITAAKAEIARGKQRIAEYVAKLPANLKQVGQQASDDIQSQFDALEESVNNKQGELIDSLATKYNENLQAIDARIDELKAANKGLVDKALDAVVGVIKTILQLKDMLLGVLARAAGVIGTIIKHPIKFLSNLIGGVKQGLMNFVSNIGTHLQKGLMTWLFGELAAGGIELPKSFDIKGILTLIMQILGMTWGAIKAQAEKMLGPKVVSVLMGAFDIFMIIKDQGIGGLWEYIKDKVGNLADMVIDGIKDLVKSQVIEAGIQWLLGILGGPAGAFIKAAKAIIDIVMWFVNNGSRVMALVNSVLDSVTAIASGSLGEAAAYIEKSLANAIPVMIGFLASLLGLGNLSQKIKGVIEKVQAPVKKAIGWVLGKAKSFASKIGGGLKKLGGKVKGALGIKDETPEQKEKRLQTGVSAGVAAVNKLEGGSISALMMRPVLGAIRMRYRLAVLEPIEQDGFWAVRGEIQRVISPTRKRKESGPKVSDEKKLRDCKKAGLHGKEVEKRGGTSPRRASALNEIKLNRYQKRLQKLQAALETLTAAQQKAEAEGKIEVVVALNRQIAIIQQQIGGIQGNVRGIQHEEKVAAVEKPIERNIVFVCKNCGLVVQEYDMRLKSGTVLEAKATPEAVSPGQFENELTLAKKIWGDATDVELAVPEGRKVVEDIEKKFEGSEVKPKICQY